MSWTSSACGVGISAAGREKDCCRSRLLKHGFHKVLRRLPMRDRVYISTPTFYLIVLAMPQELHAALSGER